MFISFAPPKETNQRKGGRKRQPPPVCPRATQSQKGATKQGEVRTFSGLPTLRYNWTATILICICLVIRLLITNEKKGDASPFQNPQVI